MMYDPDRIIIVDPPSGCKHGFPAALQEDYVKQLLDAGYSTKDIPMCLEYSRYWYDDVVTYE